MLTQTDQAVAAFFDEEEFTASAYVRAAGRSRNDDPVPDPARVAFPFRGSFEFESSINAFSGSTRSSADDVAPRQVSEAIVSALVTDMPWRPGKGDRFLRAKDGKVYVIVMVDGDGTDRVVFRVNRGS
jgi:hypothetical protein